MLFFPLWHSVTSTGLAFGVSVSSFAVNRAVRTNAMQINRHTHEQLSQSGNPFTWMTDSRVLALGWKSLNFRKSCSKFSRQRRVPSSNVEVYNEPEVLRHLPDQLVEQRTTKELPVAGEFTKVLRGINWNTESDSLHLTTIIVSSKHHVMRRMFASKIA